MISAKEILVTGGCGYIGSHVVRQLSESDVKVTVIDNLSTGFKSSLLNNEKLINIDLKDTNALEEVFSNTKFDGVIHFAASIVVPESVSKPLEYYSNNTANLLNILKCCEKFDVTKFIFSSTAAVYGETTTERVREEEPKFPTNPYAYSKLFSEQMINDYAKANENFKYGILRYFNVAGADLKSRIGQRTKNATHLIKIASEVACGKRGEIEIFGTDYDTPDGTCIRDYIHVEDLASAHLSSFAHIENHDSFTANCGYGHGSSVKEVIETVKEITGVNFKVKLSERRPGDVSKLISDNTKILGLLDWRPKFDDLNVIVKSAYDFERSLS